MTLVVVLTWFLICLTAMLNIKTLGKAQIDVMLKSVDEDNSGAVDKDEFVDWMAMQVTWTSCGGGDGVCLRVLSELTTVVLCFVVCQDELQGRMKAGRLDAYIFSFLSQDTGKLTAEMLRQALSSLGTVLKHEDVMRLFQVPSALHCVIAKRCVA